MFVVFEGPDGVGKTTTCRALADSLRPSREVLLLRFPDRSGPLGGWLDAFLKRSAPGDKQSERRAAQLLFSADRWLAAPRILEKVGGGAVVLADRWTASGGAYSVAVDGVPRESWSAADEGLPRPDLTVLLLRRSFRREGEDEERYDSAQAAVREFYADLLRNGFFEEERLLLVQGDETPEEIAALVRTRIDTLFAVR